MSKFFNELKRRNVIKSTIAYLVVSWIVIQVALAVLPTFEAPKWAIQAIMILLAVGLPIWIVISWIYDITPQIEKTPNESENLVSENISNKRLNVFLIVSLSIAVIVLTLKVSDVFSFNSDSQYAIAVLPFINMSDDKDQEWFSEGISEEIINMLAQVPKLTVIGRTSSFAFKGKNMDMKVIGEQLNVGYLLEGSVRRSGNTLRITAQLIDVANNSHIYSEKFDRELKDIFDIQDEISQHILNAVKIKLLGEEKEAVLKKYTDNTDAYQLYLKGLFYLNKDTQEGFLKAIEFFDSAIALDSTYAIAYAEKSFSYSNLVYWYNFPSDEYLPIVIATAEKALELDDQIAESHLAIGRVKLHHQWNIRDAMVAFKKALAINPNSAQVHAQLGFCYVLSNRFEKALEHADIAEKLDPVSILNLSYISAIPHFAKEYEESLRISKKIIDLEPNYFDSHVMAGSAYFYLGEYKKAIYETEVGVQLYRDSYSLSMLAQVYAYTGDTIKAREVLEEMKRREGIDMTRYSFLGHVYAVLGDLDNAFKCYNAALENHEEILLWFNLMASPEVKKDPRFIPLIEKMNVIYPP
jgi:adenylate cyclase